MIIIEQNQPSKIRINKKGDVESPPINITLKL